MFLAITPPQFYVSPFSLAYDCNFKTQFNSRVYSVLIIMINDVCTLHNKLVCESRARPYSNILPIYQPETEKTSKTYHEPFRAHQPHIRLTRKLQYCQNQLFFLNILCHCLCVCVLSHFQDLENPRREVNV